MTDELWQDIFERGQRAHEKRLNGKTLIARDECPVELTPFGYIRWYLHPKLEAPSMFTLYQFVLEIPQGSCSGKLHHQGGIVHYVLQGSGDTEVDGVRHDWEAGDVIGIPSRVMGCTFQHINTGTGLARMVVAFPNLDSAFGSFMGVHMRMLENAPEYDAQRVGVAGSAS